MATRRQFISSGMSAAALGLLGKPLYAAVSACEAPGQTPVGMSDPVQRISTRNPGQLFGDIRFDRGWTGDRLPHPSLPLVDKAPVPDEFTDVVVVGGGLSGLASAYLLRDLNPVVLEYHHRFGGQARGETWRGAQYPLGSAYVITPDTGSFLGNLYTELGMNEAHRFQSGVDDPIEIGGQILYDFWTGSAKSPEEAAQYKRFAEVVDSIAFGMYPDIPRPNNGPLQPFIFDMDTRSFKQDIEMRMGGPLPPLLAGAVQAYCYSSFGAGMEEISAVGGWNFLAAEEYGRWVLPGGNSFMVRQMWDALVKIGQQTGQHNLRSGAKVVDIRLAQGGALVTYECLNGDLHTIGAKKVVVSCPKFVATYLLHDLEANPDKLNAFHSLQYRSYVVANVLLNVPLPRDHYDVFLIGDDSFPTDYVEAQAHDSVTDALNGVYAQPSIRQNGVLSLFYPLPWDGARFSLVVDTAWEDYAEKLVPQIHEILNVLNLQRSDVARVRMTRWGHAMPIHQHVIANGIVDQLREPIEDTIYFVEQDNWALPAVENCLIDADIYTRQLRDSLK